MKITIDNSLIEIVVWRKISGSLFGVAFSAEFIKYSEMVL